MVIDPFEPAVSAEEWLQKMPLKVRMELIPIVWGLGLLKDISNCSCPMAWPKLRDRKLVHHSICGLYLPSDLTTPDDEHSRPRSQEGETQRGDGPFNGTEEVDGEDNSRDEAEYDGSNQHEETPPVGDYRGTR